MRAVSPQKAKRKFPAPTKRDQPEQYAAMVARRNERAAVVVRLQSALEDPDTLLPIASVRARTGLSDATIYRLIKAKEFPEPVRLSARCSRWKLGAVLAWLAQAGA